jgi:hypothetical protein
LLIARFDPVVSLQDFAFAITEQSFPLNKWRGQYPKAKVLVMPCTRLVTPCAKLVARDSGKARISESVLRPPHGTCKGEVSAIQRKQKAR